jgi:magnesium chelatase family protein
VRQRVHQARERATSRRTGAGHAARTNAEVPASVLLRDFRLPSTVTTLLDRAMATGALTRRGAERALRVAWTLTDLAGLERPGPDQIATALAFRDRRAT